MHQAVLQLAPHQVILGAVFLQLLDQFFVRLIQQQATGAGAGHRDHVVACVREMTRVVRVLRLMLHLEQRVALGRRQRAEIVIAGARVEREQEVPVACGCRAQRDAGQGSESTQLRDG